jgi:hypothetical protein
MHRFICQLAFRRHDLCSTALIANIAEFALGVKNDRKPSSAMSPVYLRTADISRRGWQVSSVPEADSCAARKTDDAPFRLRASLM